MESVPVVEAQDPADLKRRVCTYHILATHGNQRSLCNVPLDMDMQIQFPETLQEADMLIS